MASAPDRLDAIPLECPRCRLTKAPGRLELPEWLAGVWLVFYSIPDAPAVGCRNCGCVIYVTQDAIDSARRTKRVPA